jgi:hypothetical protein
MEKKDSAEKVVRGYDLLFEWIETARLFGDVEEPWCAVEIAHWLQLRRYEILTASDEQTIVSLYHDIFVDDPVAEPLKLCDELRQICLNYPFLLMDERAEGRALFLLAPRASAPVAVTVAVKCAQSGRQGSARAFHPTGLDRTGLIEHKTALEFPIRSTSIIALAAVSACPPVPKKRSP